MIFKRRAKRYMSDRSEEELRELERKLEEAGEKARRTIDRIWRVVDFILLLLLIYAVAGMDWGGWAIILLLAWLLLYGLTRWQRLDWFANLFERYYRSCDPATTRKLEWAVALLFGVTVTVSLLVAADVLGLVWALIAQISVMSFLALLVVVSVSAPGVVAWRW